MTRRAPLGLRKALFLFLVTLPACGAFGGEDTPKLAPTDPTQLRAYWDQGKAEVTSYELQQSRYGELHDGHAVLIFVREDLSRSKHVKLDAPGRAGADAVSVLKLNTTLKFTTGIYPYSIMQSVFTPTDRTNTTKTLKVTTSAQEWCGHVFSQLDAVPKGFDLVAHSYFESEGELELTLPDLPLEDELWNLIRIDPSALPLGEFQLIPGSIDARLRHRKPSPQKAVATLSRVDQEGKQALAYQVEYETMERGLTIVFEEAFPHAILGWEETGKTGKGQAARALISRATRQKSLLTDYWNRNGVADKVLRGQLGLP